MAVGPQDEEKAAKHLDALEALGLIEFAPPPERVQLRIQVIDRLQQIMTEVGWTRGRTCRRAWHGSRASWISARRSCFPARGRSRGRGW